MLRPSRARARAWCGAGHRRRLHHAGHALNADALQLHTGGLDAAQVHCVVHAPMRSVVTARQALHLVAVAAQKPPVHQAPWGRSAFERATAAPLCQASPTSRNAPASAKPRHAIKVRLGVVAVQQALAGPQRRHGDGQLARDARRVAMGAQHHAAVARLALAAGAAHHDHRAAAHGGGAKAGGRLWLQQRAGEEGPANLGAWWCSRGRRKGRV